MSHPGSAYLSGSVHRKERPSLLVIHEEGGDWQSLDGSRVDPDDAVVVHLEHVFDGDSDLSSPLDLPSGWAAERATSEDAWRRSAWRGDPDARLVARRADS